MEEHEMKEKDYEYSPNLTAEELDTILEDVEREGGLAGPKLTYEELITSLYEEFGDKKPLLEKLSIFFSEFYQKLLRVMRLTK